MPLVEQSVSIESAGAVLAARLHAAADPAVAAVFCHPHPRYGGDMDKSVVTALVDHFFFGHERALVDQVAVLVDHVA